jgi:predicted dehydrogenase/aryl-alcohol dehydrogenase-like predicted oxidoreductase
MSDDSRLAWGIIGTGAIAATLANNMVHSRTARLAAVASRDQAKADTFGDKHGVPAGHRHGSYAALLADPMVRAVYIATPHPSHAEWAIKAAEAGKHVLVEKPMAVHRHEAEAIVEAAVANHVLLMEAFMYRCHPQTSRLVELLAERAIGDVKVIQATFSFHAGFDPKSRLFRNDLAGGGIMDVGCYPASIARLIAGAATGAPFANATSVKAVAHLESTGVDGYTVAVATFPSPTGDILAQLATGVVVSQENVVRIFGTGGKIILRNPWVAERTGGDAGHITVHRHGEKEPQEISMPATVTSFAMELDVFGDAVAAGRTEAPSPAMSWGDSLGNLALLDAWRASAGVVFDREKLDTYPKVTVANRPLSRRADAPITYGTVPHLDKKVSRLVMGVDNQATLPHAAVMFDAFHEAGGNCFDTAYIYAGGVNERMLGQWIHIRGVRKDVVVICKGCHPPETVPGAIGRQLTVSLDRLNIDHCDLYMMHRDDESIPVGEWVDALNEQAKAGRMIAFGGSNWTPARVQAANDYAAAKGLQGFSLISDNFSLARMVSPVWAGCVSASDPESRAWLAKSKVPLFAWSSQARGFFTERAHRDLSRNDEEMNRCWAAEDNWKRRDRVLELAEKRDVLPINIALAYVLCQPFATFPLIGPRTLAELRTSLPALGVSLTAEEVKWLNLEA